MLRMLKNVFVAAILSLASLGVGLAGEEKSRPPADAAFPMVEVPLFGRAPSVDKKQKVEPIYGSFAECTAEPDRSVRAYPKFHSQRRQYGEFRFNKLTYNRGEGPAYRFAVDESGGTGKGYDRLYFDANGDGDLTDDPVLQPMAKPPAEAIVPYWKEKQIIFDGLSVPVDYGPGVGVRPFKLLARLVLIDEKRISLWFLPTVERKGEIAVGNRHYNAALRHPNVITGRFDRPYVWLELTPANPRDKADSWWGSEMLGAMHEVDGQLYSFSATPRGDKLFVKPYRGKFGTLALDPGRLNLKRWEMRGTLQSQSAAFRLGRRPAGQPPAEMAKEFLVPVGDYLPSILSINYGRLRFTLSEMYHSDGHRRDRQGKPLVYAIRIREEKPFVLDFSAAPRIVFTDPARDHAFHRGDEVKVAAVLTDPTLDIMIRSLEDLDRKQKEVYKFKDGKERTTERPLKLDPMVTIADSSGKQLAKGKMPFG